MTDPTRWSDVSGDTDPVLRAVMRYAQQIEPSPQDVASLAAAVARAEAKMAASRATGRPPLPRLGAWVAHSRRTLCWAGSLALAGACGAALAWNLEVSSSQRAIATVAPEIIHDERVPSVPAPAVRGEVPAPVPAVSARPPRPARVPTALPVPPAPPASGSATEVSLLTTARHTLGKDPQRTLLLLTTHESKYPASSFTEERAALRIEALYRMGRTAEADRDYAWFSQRFPASIYMPRLVAARARE